MRDWSDIRHFKPAEWKQDPDRVDTGLAGAMDQLREMLGAPIIIHEAWAPSGHGKDSLHYSGGAVDFHVQGGPPFVRVLLAVLSIPAFMGVGWYPKWTHPGFHVDIRQTQTRLLWVKQNGIYRYGPSAMAKAVHEAVSSASGQGPPF